MYMYQGWVHVDQAWVHVVLLIAMLRYESGDLSFDQCYVMPVTRMRVQNGEDDWNGMRVSSPHLFGVVNASDNMA